MDRKKHQCKCKIDTVEKTTDTLSSRAGLTLFVHYLSNILLYPHLERLFGGMRKSLKGQPVVDIFRQLFCFMLDGTSRHLVYFDTLKEDPGYAGVIETRKEAMLSSHSVKRFFKAFSWYRIWLFRGLLQQLFVWRVKLTKPEMIELGIDTMVMDNDEADQRHGVEPTYKKVKGFQPLQMTWGRFLIDAVFRGGKKHSNHGDTVEKMVRHMVGKIRKAVGEAIPILIRMDAGFFDEKLFEVFEGLGIGYICSGKIYEDVKRHVQASERLHWGRYQRGKQMWDFVEFGSRRERWKKFRRAVFCRPLESNGQMLLEFVRPVSVLYTNLGMGFPIDQQLRDAGYGHLLNTESIIGSAHGRGADELVHRALKDFGSQVLPFKRFAPNAAFYYTLLVAFFLYECFKEDVCGGVVPLEAYPTTLRRKVIDVAAKIVRTSGKIILKVASAAWDFLGFDKLWNKCAHPPVFCWT
jgi:hypothetical protein